MPEPITAEQIVMAEMTRRNARAGLPPPRRISITRGDTPCTEQELADGVFEALEAIGRGEFSDLPPLDDSRRHVDIETEPLWRRATRLDPLRLNF